MRPQTRETIRGFIERTLIMPEWRAREAARRLEHRAPQAFIEPSYVYAPAMPKRDS